jgi:hypothetical protein
MNLTAKCQLITALNVPANTEIDLAVVATLKSQIQIRGLCAMWGADFLVHLRAGLAFHFKAPASNHANVIAIEYNAGTDYYEISFYRFRAGKLTQISRVVDVYAPALLDILESETGLRCTLPRVVGLNA